MPRGYTNLSLDLMLRSGGLAAALVAWCAIRHLAGDYAFPARHDPSLIDALCAATGFLGFSAGAVLGLWGAHIFDRIEVSQRWARRSAHRPRTVETAGGACRMLPAEPTLAFRRHCGDR